MTCKYYTTQVLTLSKTSHVIFRFQGPQMRPQIKRKLAVTIKGEDGKCNEAIKKTSLPKLLHHMAFYKGRRLNSSQNSSTTITVQADDCVVITFSVIQSPKELKEQFHQSSQRASLVLKNISYLRSLIYNHTQFNGLHCSEVILTPIISFPNIRVTNFWQALEQYYKFCTIIISDI